MEKISASIVTYNTEVFLLKRAMDSFLSSNITGPLVIIDNSPTDYLKQFCEDIDSVTYIYSRQNLGYGKAHNIAIRKHLDQSKYHLVLNPDVYFDATTLEKMYYFMEAHPQAGLAMPKVYNTEGEFQMNCKLLPAPINLATRRFFPIKSWFKKINDRYEMQERGFDHVMNVPFLSGCFMFLRTSSLKHTGLFDEQFFLYAEDTDLSRRIHQQFETLFFPGAAITHLHARGSYKDFNLTFQNLKSAIQYFNKWGWFFDLERKQINARALSQTNRIAQEDTSLDKIKVA
jgi:hypothetical protein